MFAYNDRSFLARWWFGVDKISLFLLLILMGVGVLLNFSATPAIARYLNHPPFYFVKRHFLFLLPSLLVMVSVSSCDHAHIRMIGMLTLLVSGLLLILTPVIGTQIKGATRWIFLAGVSVQASEFAKPALTVLTGWLLSKQLQQPAFPGLLLSAGLLMFFCACTLLQPDLGMTLVFVGSWFTQLFVAGLPILWVVGTGLAGIGGLVSSYFIFPHVHHRIQAFLYGQEEQYQVMKSIEAFAKGGLIGVGPGEGTIKRYVPDAHADFIFSVAGEEFGLICCLIIVALYLCLAFRSFVRIYQSQSPFALLAGTGIVAQLSMQSLVNMASCLGLIPTKGMTLPLISYGGSSLLALMLSCSILLSLTSKRL